MARTSRFLVSVAAVGALALAGCAGQEAELGSAENPVKLGVTGASEPYWAVYEEAVEAAGIAIEIVDFTDYNQPNPALSQGELDVNQFQHIVYLANYNDNAGDDITPIGSTAIYPIGLYSTQYESVDDIAQGDTVIVPNDDTNQARGLLVLQSAGLVSLKDGGGATSTVDDVIAEESRVTVRAVDAATTATSLPDAAAAIINNDFITDAGLTPEDAIAKDDPSDPAARAYVNIFATTQENADNAVLAKLVEIYQSNEDVQAGVLEASGGTAQLLQTPKAELQELLAQTQTASGK